MISLNIFTKCPYTGNPKTRLKKLLTVDERIFITSHMLTNILDEVSSFMDDVKVTLWVYPNAEHSWFKQIKKKYNLILKKQKGSCLCERMNYCLSFESLKHSQTILVGSDIPSLSKKIILEALSILSNEDIVIGPSSDDGFYLIGGNGLCKNLISCTESMNMKNLEDSIYSQSKSIGLLRVLKDIDTPRDLLVI